MAQQGQEDDDEEEEVTKSVTSQSVDVDFNCVDEGGNRGGGKAARLPRWTRQEILVLIQGKRVAENRVRRGRTVALCEGEGSQGQQVEPKWATVSSYCKRHGVNRGPVQCRKRWSNLAGDFKKIKEWDSQIKDESDSYWLMRNDVRRERKLPGFFDREVFDILTSNSSSSSGIPIPIIITDTNTNTPRLKLVDGEGEVEVVFDSGRSATAADGLFSDFEQSAQPPQHHHQQQETEDDEMGKRSPENVADADAPPPFMSSTPAPPPISEKQYQPVTAEATAGANEEKQKEGLNPEKGSTSREGGGRKRRRALEEEEAQDELVQVLERNGRVLSAQLDAYNLNLKLDREQRKNHASSLVAVLNKLADALGRIADKI